MTFGGGLQDILSFVGIRALATSDSLPMRALRFMCETSFIGQEICKSILFDIFGHSENFNMASIKDAFVSNFSLIC